MLRHKLSGASQPFSCHLSVWGWRAAGARGWQWKSRANDVAVVEWRHVRMPRATTMGRPLQAMMRTVPATAYRKTAIHNHENEGNITKTGRQGRQTVASQNPSQRTHRCGRQTDDASKHVKWQDKPGLQRPQAFNMGRKDAAAISPQNDLGASGFDTPKLVCRGFSSPPGARRPPSARFHAGWVLGHRFPARQRDSAPGCGSKTRPQVVASPGRLLACFRGFVAACAAAERPFASPIP